MIKETVEKAAVGTNVLDVGCGKGRCLKNPLWDVMERNYYAVDISKNVMKFLKDANKFCKEGTLTNIPYEDDKFSVVYVCETLVYE